MPRVTKKAGETQAKQDVLEVVHHEIPDTAAGAGAAAIPAPRTEAAPATTPAGKPATEPTTATTKQITSDPTADRAAATYTATTGGLPAAYKGHGMTWRRMLRAVALTEAAGGALLLVALSYYGVPFFAPLAISAILFAVAAVWIPRMSKAGAVYSLVVSSLMLVFFGGLMFGWTGFLSPRSWFEMSFATMTVIVPIAGITAGIAALRHRDGTDAARTPAIATGVLCAAIVVTGIVGAATATDASPLPGDVHLTAKAFEFQQTALTAKSGDVAIYFENTDPFAHNVHIDGHGTSPNAAGRQSIRYVFHALAAGTYAFNCEIHPDMKGTLTVT